MSNHTRSEPHILASGLHKRSTLVIPMVPNKISGLPIHHSPKSTEMGLGRPTEHTRPQAGPAIQLK